MSPMPAARRAALGDVQMSILGTAWFLATWVPYELQQALDHRISYTYYMIVVMPGIYVAVIHLVTLGFRTRTPLVAGADHRLGARSCSPR